MNAHDEPLQQSVFDNLTAEIYRLNQALKWEQYRSERVGTHGTGCETWGPAHYECLLRKYKNGGVGAIKLEHEQMRNVLEHIAAHKRRTREQRLAAACLTFLDAVAEDVKSKEARSE